MQNTALSRFLTIFRIALGWTFLYVGATQLTEPNFTAATFLAHTTRDVLNQQSFPILLAH